MEEDRTRQKEVEKVGSLKTGSHIQHHPRLDPKSPQWQRLVEVVESYRGKNGMVIPLLQEVQAIFNYIPEKAFDYITDELGIPSSAIYGIITFYAQFYTEPRGKHVIRACRGTACHVKGGKAVLRAIENHLGVGEGETTTDTEFTLETVACLGTCALAPVMIIDHNYYGNLNPQKAVDILQRYGKKK